MGKLAVTLLVCLFVFKVDSCEDGVCLTWSVTLHQLKLKCKVGRLLHRVQFINPLGNVSADCVPPIPTIRCESHFPNGSISQNVTTNETFYTVNGTIDYHVNGKWSCTHGTGWGTADVEVTVLKVKVPDLETVTENATKKEDMKVNLSGNHQCLKETVLYSFTPSFLVIMLIQLIMFYGKHFEKTRNFFSQRCDCCFSPLGKIAMIFPIATIVLLVVMLIVSSTEKSDCHSKYIFCPFTVVFSVLNSLFFFKGPKGIESVQQQPQQLQQRHQQLQQQHEQLQQRHQQLQQQHQQLQQQVQQKHHQHQENQPQQENEGQNEENPGEPLLNSVEEQIPN